MGYRGPSFGLWIESAASGCGPEFAVCGFPLRWSRARADAPGTSLAAVSTALFVAGPDIPKQHTGYSVAPYATQRRTSRRE
eukprot:3381481-Rhodomonas_salina.1